MVWTNKYECDERLYIDKDILYPGNKVYSPDTCLLVPQHDLKSIDKIESLEEAKEIIRMITGNVYLNCEMYSLQREYYESRNLPGGYIKDCLSCSNSFSEENQKDKEYGDILHCTECNGAVVEEDGYCDKWN